MEETRIGIFRAFINTFKAFDENTEKADNPIEFSDLTKKDFEYANINQEVQQVLGMSLTKLKGTAVGFFNNIKSKAKKTMSKYKEQGETEVKTPTIDKNQIKKGEQDIEISK